MERTTVDVERLVPNTWNHNQMDPVAYKKLKGWLTRSLKKSGRIALPVVVRTHPTEKGKYQIIDGEHRWRAVGEIGETKVDVHIYECDDIDARMLTDALNYIRGTPDQDREAAYLQDLLTAGGTIEEMAEFTHKSKDELEDIVESYDIKFEDVAIPELSSDDGSSDTFGGQDDWMELKFNVPKDAALIIESELSRIGALLKGKNIRGRALEYMAVNSAHTPVDNLTGEEQEKKEEATTQKLSRLKRKLRGKAA